MTKQIVLDYTPQPKQSLLHASTARQIFFGGSAGGGKSHSVRWDAILCCLRNPGLDAYLFRRTLTELEGTHIRRLRQELPDGPLGRYNETKKRFDFTSGSMLNFCFCEKEHDVDKYLSEEFHWLGLDEASKFSEYQLTMLRTRVRLGGFIPSDAYKGFLPRVVMASNPGGPAHSFLKTTFIDPAPPMTLFRDATTKNPATGDEGWLSIYIPSRMSDNRYIDEAEYAGAFSALAPELARAYRDGDWDAVVGQALHTLNRDRHGLRPFTPPKHWTRFMSMDWGTARPFSIGWYAVSEGGYLKGQEGWPDKVLPKGAVVLYDEWYGWDGRANKGCRMEAAAVARKIIERETARQEIIDYRVGDSAMWAQMDGPSPQENMKVATDGRIVLRPSKKDRKAGYHEFLSRLAGSPTYMEDGRVEDHPMFFATMNCNHFWRTVPILTLDDNDPDKGPDTKLEDHCYDSTVYALMSRAFVTTEQDRQDEIDRPYLERMKPVDPYATA